MAAASARTAPFPPSSPHVPVLLGPLLAAVAPVTGLWVDGTFGAGGYARGLAGGGGRSRHRHRPRSERLRAGGRLGGGFRRPAAAGRGDVFRPRPLAGAPVDGVVLDLGVSSMQLDQAGRGFSFLKDGPLDMRMSGAGPTAADLVNSADEGEIADILYHYGEERASRRIARAIVAGAPARPRRKQLAAVVDRLPAARQARPEPPGDPQLSGDPHRGERRVRPARRRAGGRRTGAEARRLAGGGHLPFARGPGRQALLPAALGRRGAGQPPRPGTRGAIVPAFRRGSPRHRRRTTAELAANPRARSAKLRIGMPHRRPGRRGRSRRPRPAAPCAERTLT